MSVLYIRDVEEGLMKRLRVLSAERQQAMKELVPILLDAALRECEERERDGRAEA